MKTSHVAIADFGNNGKIWSVPWFPLNQRFTVIRIQKHIFIIALLHGYRHLRLRRPPPPRSNKIKRETALFLPCLNCGQAKTKKWLYCFSTNNHVWSRQKCYSYEKKRKQNCILKKIHLFVVQTHVFITATYHFLTKKNMFDDAEYFIHRKQVEIKNLN